MQNRLQLLMFFVVIAVVAIALAGIAKSEAPRARSPHAARWRDLPPPSSVLPDAAGGAEYFTFKLDNGSQAHLVVVDWKAHNWLLRPAICKVGTAPTSTIAAANHASVAVNGGFFNLSDGVSASYVIMDGRAVTDPPSNQALISNPKLKPFLSRIFNRSEFRVLRSGKQLTVQIARHNEPLPRGATIVSALQSGPRLLPDVDAADEAFLRRDADGKEVDSIGINKHAARTACGITDDGFVVLLAVSGSGQDPESSGITVQELAKLLKRLGCVEALNFDGGASTTMYVRSAGSAESGKVVCGKTPETRVKSILMLEPFDYPQLPVSQ